MRHITGAAVAAAATCGLTAVTLISCSGVGHSAPIPRVAKTAHHAAGSPSVSAAPYYVAISVRFGTATVRRTATGAKIATVRRGRGLRFFAVAAAADDRTFVLAGQTSSGGHFYRLRLSRNGRPGRLVLTPVPPIPATLGHCPAQLAGLAVSPGGSLLAASLLSNCPTGNAGPSEILTVRLASGRTAARFHPGDGYPMWLSWTASGGLAYSWTSRQTGIFIIPRATAPGSSPRLLIRGSASVGRFSEADYPLITSDGSALFATVARGSSTFAIAEFSLRGTARRLLTPPVGNPAQFCGPLWTDASGSRILTGCGDNSEYEIRNGHLTKLHKPWQLPFYAVPSPPLIAW
ncbi:MAG TPA: hypothetical protein VEV63_10560 [Streptosporangiaceae bacterium]|nr:hypothetical protein [Streptosporangiaceae bacterium]